MCWCWTVWCNLQGGDLIQHSFGQQPVCCSHSLTGVYCCVIAVNQHLHVLLWQKSRLSVLAIEGSHAWFAALHHSRVYGELGSPASKNLSSWGDQCFGRQIFSVRMRVLFVTKVVDLKKKMSRPHSEGVICALALQQKVTGLIIHWELRVFCLTVYNFHPNSQYIQDQVECSLEIKHQCKWGPLLGNHSECSPAPTSYSDWLTLLVTIKIKKIENEQIN